MLLAEPRSTDGAEFIPLAATCSVTFHGAGSGRVVVGVTADVLPALAGNMLGSAESPDIQLQRDALGELVNVLTGNVLPLVHGASAVFRLGAPVAVTDAPFTARDGEIQVGFAHLQMDEGDAILAMFSDSTAAATPNGTMVARA